MALPSSGAISMTDIRGEFGGSAPDGINEYYRGGGLVPNTPANAGIPTSGAISFADFYGATNIDVNVTNHTISGAAWQETNSTPPPASLNRNGIAVLRVLNTGVLRGEASQSGIYPDGGSPAFTTTNYSGEWLAAGSASDLDVRFTLTSGTVSGSATATYLNCATTRTWTNQTGSPAVGTLEFRPAGGGAVVASATITMNSA